MRVRVLSLRGCAHSELCVATVSSDAENIIHMMTTPQQLTATACGKSKSSEQCSIMPLLLASVLSLPHDQYNFV